MGNYYMIGANGQRVDFSQDMERYFDLLFEKVEQQKVKSGKPTDTSHISQYFNSIEEDPDFDNSVGITPNTNRYIPKITSANEHTKTDRTTVTKITNRMRMLIPAMEV